MITQTFAGVVASIDLYIADVAVNYKSIVNMEFMVDENLHDYASIEIAGIPTRAVTDYYGASVEFSISSGANFVHEFHGTVETVIPISKAADGITNGSPFQQARLICYGPSYRMRGKRSQVWESVSLTELATKLANKYSFSVSVPEVKMYSSRFVQEEESDWAALVRYAGKYGYRVNVHGTHLHVYDPQKALSRNRSHHRLTTSDTTGRRSVPGKIMEFQAQLGRSAADGVYDDAYVTVLHPDTGVQHDVKSSEVFGKTGTPSFSRRVDAVVDNLAEAKSVIYAEASNSYDYEAHVRCLGLAGAYPGGVVDLDRYRSNVDGYWYVKSVKHTVNSSAFFTDLTLQRNIDLPLSESSVAVYAKPPAPVLRNGVWETSKLKVDTYA